MSLPWALVCACLVIIAVLMLYIGGLWCWIDLLCDDRLGLLWERLDNEPLRDRHGRYRSKRR